MPATFNEPPNALAPVPTVKIFVPVTNRAPLNVFTAPLNKLLPVTFNVLPNSLAPVAVNSPVTAKLPPTVSLPIMLALVAVKIVAVSKLT